MVVPEIALAGAVRYAEALREKIADHPFVGRETQPLGKITLSFGVASYPDSGTDATALIGHADKALHRSKHAGRNRVSVWEPSLV